MTSAVRISDSIVDLTAKVGTTGNSSAEFSALYTAARMQANNNSTGWDQWFNNMNATLLASAARTASVNSTDQTNYNGRGLHVIINVTAIVTAPSVVFTIQGKDPISGTYYTLLASAAITAVGTTILRVYPGLAASANAVANDILPRTWRISAAHANGDSITYSVGASVIL